MNNTLVISFMIFGLSISTVRADEPITISEAKKDDSGFLIHEVRSPYQAKNTSIRVLLPDDLAKTKKYTVVYVLPVEPENESRYGDGLKEVKKLDLHNKLEVIFVAPTFSQLPWYADHPSKPEVRQESYFVKVVVSFIDKHYPVKAEPQGRRLLGFSKSGWGAWSLLLRNSDRFGNAVAWDAPLMMDKPGKYGSGDIFSTQENFDKYRLNKLLVDKAENFQKDKRIILLGYGNFRIEHEKVHALMENLKVSHEYRDGPARKHDWHSGWVQEAIELLLRE